MFVVLILLVFGCADAVARKDKKSNDYPEKTPPVPQYPRKGFPWKDFPESFLTTPKNLSPKSFCLFRVPYVPFWGTTPLYPEKPFLYTPNPLGYPVFGGVFSVSFWGNPVDTTPIRRVLWDTRIGKDTETVSRKETGKRLYPESRENGCIPKRNGKETVSVSF